MSLTEYGVRNPVVVNLLMLAILVSAVVLGSQLRREFFPESDPDQAMVTLPYPGASPEEIEQSLAIKVEDKLFEVDEVRELRTTLSEGGGGIVVEFREGVNARFAYDEVDRALSELTDLPQEAERITVQLFEPRIPVIRVAVFGDMDEAVLKRSIRAVRDDLRTLPGMGEIVIEGVRDYEVRIDVQNDAMLKLGVSLPQIADTVGAWMREVPGGTVRTATGDIKVRTMGVAERAAAIRDLVLRATPDGRIIKVGDVAEVTESFIDERIINRFNGQPAATLTIFKVGQQDIVQIAEMTRAYVDGRRGLPFHARGFERLMPGPRQQAWELGHRSPNALLPEAQVALTSDLARFVEGRLELLTRNALYGATLVFLTLLLFLNWRAAFWVGMGLVIAIGGTIVAMYTLDITLNLLTMFGLIVVLGLLVDDAIVVGENIQTMHDKGTPALVAAIEGTRRVKWPVIATIATSIVAFMPLTFIRGRIGDLLGALPVVVAVALLVSLIEALFILPSHMGHTLRKRDASKPSRATRYIRAAEGFRDRVFFDRVVPAYESLLRFCLRFRYGTIAVGVAAVIVSLGMVAGGHVVFTFLADDDAETIVIDVRMPIGTPIDRTEQIVRRIEEAAQAQPETLNVAVQVGQATNIDTGAADAFAPHVAQMFVELVFVEDRDRESSQVIDSIRQALGGQVDEADRVRFTEISGGPGGADISLRVAGDDPEELTTVADAIKRLLAQFDGVYDIHDDQDLGQLELRWTVNASGAALGFTASDVARQVRGALYGIEAHTFAADQEDIDVRVRLDEPTRRSLFAIENLWLVSPQGDPVPLSEIADLEESETYASIRRVDRRRTVTVTADTAPWLSPESIVQQIVSPSTEMRYRLGFIPYRASVGPSPLDELRAAHPRIGITFAGRQEQLGDAFDSLPWGFAAALLMIYVILAILFSSYLQPIIVLLAVPFSIVGVVWGHLLFGYDMTFLSLIGFVALSGIVVNDSLILVEFFNEMRHKGMDLLESLVAAGKARIRAILLTTLTTTLGLMPLLLEQSFQAKFLIPMAISISMGLVSATALVLLLLPCFIMAFGDLRRLGYFMWHGEATTLPPMSRRVELELPPA
jgi:HAE1 family hydrophobic/amphiphilic exporter-1